MQTRIERQQVHEPSPTHNHTDPSQRPEASAAGQTGGPTAGWSRSSPPARTVTWAGHVDTTNPPINVLPSHRAGPKLYLDNTQQVRLACLVPHHAERQAAHVLASGRNRKP